MKFALNLADLIRVVGFRVTRFAGRFENSVLGMIMRTLGICCLVLSLVVAGASNAMAGCNRIFVRFYFPNGGDDTWDLKESGGNFQDITGRVQFYKKNGVWTLTAADGSVWTRAGDPCAIGGGFTLQQNGIGPTPTRVVVPETAQQ